MFLKYSAAIDEGDTTFNFETKEGADRPVCTFGGDLLLPRQAGHGHFAGHHGETLTSVSDAGWWSEAQIWEWWYNRVRLKCLISYWHHVACCGVKHRHRDFNKCKLLLWPDCCQFYTESSDPLQLCISLFFLLAFHHHNILIRFQNLNP